MVLLALAEQKYMDKFANPFPAARRGYVDEIILPRDTRARLISDLEMLQQKRRDLPNRKISNIPL